MVYFDFCKALPNEDKEHHLSSLFNLLTNNLLLDGSVLITNHCTSTYFQEPKIRNFIEKYTGRDYKDPLDAGYFYISARAMSDGKNLFRNIFAEEHWAGKGDTEFLEQQVRIIFCFMIEFVRDIAEIYIPVSRLLAESHELITNYCFINDFTKPIKDIHFPCPMPTEIKHIHQELFGFGKMHKNAETLENAMENAPAKVREVLLGFIGSIDNLKNLAAFSDFHKGDIPIRSIYRLQPMFAAPYRLERVGMVPIVWACRREETASSQDLWGMKDIV